MAEKVKVPPPAALSTTQTVREVLRAIMAEEGLDALLRAAKLAADIEARVAEGEGDERAVDRWRSRSRFLSNMITMTGRVEGRG